MIELLKVLKKILKNRLKKLTKNIPKEITGSQSFILFHTPFYDF